MPSVKPVALGAQTKRKCVILMLENGLRMDQYLHNGGSRSLRNGIGGRLESAKIEACLIIFTQFDVHKPTTIKYIS
jgi:hypothetical protein